jgi:hypothetical protein
MFGGLILELDVQRTRISDEHTLEGAESVGFGFIDLTM